MQKFVVCQKPYHVISFNPEVECSLLSLLLVGVQLVNMDLSEEWIDDGMVSTVPGSSCNTDVPGDQHAVVLIGGELPQLKYHTYSSANTRGPSIQELLYDGSKQLAQGSREPNRASDSFYQPSFNLTPPTRVPKASY